MATVNVRCFADPDNLKEFKPQTLLRLFGPHRGFLKSRGINLPEVVTNGELDYDTMATVFLSPDDIPAQLAESFHLVREMSGKEAMDQILDAARTRRPPMEFAADASPPDIAAQLLLEDKPLFRELHAVHAVNNYRSFVMLVAKEKRENFKMPDDLEPLQNSLNDWYEKHRRGRSARVFWRQKDDEYRIYIRHAEPRKCQGCYGESDDDSRLLVWRPERHDLVIVNPSKREMQVFADCKNEPELFRKIFGEHLFSDPDFFPCDKEKYTLDPLRTKQRTALDCGGIEGMVSVTLKEVEFFRPGALWERESHAAEDVFTVFEARAFVIPETFVITRAKFAVRYSDSKQPRMVTIRGTNRVVVGLDDDGTLCKNWLALQGFSLNEDETNGSDDESLEQP